MRRILKATLAGKPATIKRIPQVIDDDGDLCHGLCDLVSRTIWLEDDLQGAKLLRYLLHEALHMLGDSPHLRFKSEAAEETWVDVASKDLAVLIKRYGLLKE